MFFPVPPRPEQPDAETQPPKPSPSAPLGESGTDSVRTPSTALVVVGVLLGAVVLTSFAIRLPLLAAANSPYDSSYLFSTVGYTVLFSATSIWLIRRGLGYSEPTWSSVWRHKSGGRRAVETVLVLSLCVLGVLLYGYFTKR